MWGITIRQHITMEEKDGLPDRALWNSLEKKTTEDMCFGQVFRQSNAIRHDCASALVRVQQHWLSSQGNILDYNVRMKHISAKIWFKWICGAGFCAIITQIQLLQGYLNPIHLIVLCMLPTIASHLECQWKQMPNICWEHDSCCLVKASRRENPFWPPW